MITKEEIDFKTRSHCKYFYNIMPIINIPSVIENGILRFYKTQSISHASVALTTVQERREQVTIPNGGKLHSYANLYFTYHNPMMYRRQNEAENLCVLVIDLNVLEIPGCILSDRNAAADLVKFYSPEDGFDKINFNLVYAQSWIDPDNFYSPKKAIKCAEILVPNCVPYKYLLGAYVLDENSQRKLIDLGFDKKIIVKRSVFFR